MCAAGIQGIRRNKIRKTTSGDGAETDRQADLVKRAFTATAPNQLWDADLTYIRTHAGWTYAAFVLDVFSRRVVGWQLSTSLLTARTDLTLDALGMGFWERRRAGQDITGLIITAMPECSIEPFATPSASPKPSRSSEPSVTATTVSLFLPHPARMRKSWPECSDPCV